MTREDGEPEGRGDERAHRRVCALFDACRGAGTARGTRAAALVSVIFGARVARARAVRLPVERYDPSTGILRIGRGDAPPGEAPRDGDRGGRVADAEGALAAEEGAREVLDAWREIRGGAPGPLFCRIGGHGRPVPDARLDRDAPDRILRWWAVRRAGLRELDVPELRRRYRSPWWRPAPDAGEDRGRGARGGLTAAAG